MTWLRDHRILRFLAVGLLNTAFSYTVYALLLFAGLPYALANLGALLLGIAFGFRTQGTLVFDNRDPRRIGRFAAFWGVVWAFNVGLIALLVRAGLDAYSAGAIALVPVTVASYLGQRHWVFAVRGPRR